MPHSRIDPLEPHRRRLDAFSDSILEGSVRAFDMPRDSGGGLEHSVISDIRELS